MTKHRLLGLLLAGAIALTPAVSTVPVSANVTVNGQAKQTGLCQKEIDNAHIVYEYFHDKGYNKRQCAAIMGTLSAVSGIDPTAVEDVYDENYTIGYKKQTIIDEGFLLDDVMPAYVQKFPKIKGIPCGIGMLGWTGSQNEKLRKAAGDDDWYDINVQLKFMTKGSARAKYLRTKYKKYDGSAKECAREFVRHYLGYKWNGQSDFARRVKERTDMYYNLTMGRKSIL